MRYLVRLVPAFAVSLAVYTALMVPATFFFRPVAIVTVAVATREYLFAQLLVDRGDGVLAGASHVAKPTGAVERLSLRLDPGANRGVRFAFRNGAAGIPRPLGIESVELTIDEACFRWTPEQIARDFQLRDVGATRPVARRGGPDLLLLEPSGTTPSLVLASGIPPGFTDAFAASTRRWTAARAVVALLSCAVLASLLPSPSWPPRPRPGGIADRVRAHAARWRPAPRRAARILLPAAGLLALFAFLFPNISIGNHQPVGEALDDFLVVQYYAESLINGILPIWNPFVNNGQPFTWDYLTMNFPHVATCWALLLGLAATVADFNVNHAVKLLLLVDMAIMTVGVRMLLAELVPALPRAAATAVAVVACYVYAIWYYAGLYLTILAMYMFLPFCLLFIHRFARRPSTEDLWRLVLSYALLIHSAGSYIVPFTLILGNFALAHLVCGLRRARAGALPFLAARLPQLLLMGLTLLAAAGHKVLLYLTESRDIVRIGRDIGDISFHYFLFGTDQGARGWGRIASWFVTGDQAVTFLGGVTLFFFAHALLERSFWRRNIPLILFTAFVGSAVLMERSPFLWLYYDVLFPALRRFIYWGVFYDVLLLVYLIVVAEGIRSFAARRDPLRALAAWLPVAGLYAWLLARGRVEAFSPWHVAALLPVIATLYLLRRERRSAAAALACWAALVLMTTEYGFHLAGQLDRSRERQQATRLVEDPLFRRGVVRDYASPARRSIQARRGYELWMFGTPPIARELTYNPQNAYITSRMQQETDAVLDEENRRAKYGITRDLVGLFGEVRLHASRGEMLDAMRREPAAEHLLVADAAERARIDGLLRAGDPGAPADCAVVSFDPNRLAVDVRTPGPRILIVADSWHRDWRARVDGAEAPIHLANGAFKAVLVPSAGGHRVELSFVPPLFTALFVASQLSVLVPLLFLLRRPAGARRGPPPGAG